MKFLVLALCVCAANAASFGYQPYKPNQPTQQFPRYRQPTPAAVPKAAYEAAKFVATPFVAASAVVTDSPAVKTFVEVAAKPVYNTAEAVAKVPEVAVKAYEPVRAVSKTGYTNEAEADIVRFDSDVSAEGYKYGYETRNGIVAESSGALKNIDGTDYVVSQGYYQYIAPDGTPVKVEYIADENGFQPRSNLLPVGPPIPEAIARSLEYLRTHVQKTEY